MERAKGVYEGDRLRAFMALAWLYGLRISEILSLKLGDVYVSKEGYKELRLVVRYHVLKKHNESEMDKITPTLLSVKATHPYVSIVLAWKARHIGDGFLFPGTTAAHIQVVKRKWISKGVAKEAEHRYPREGGMMSATRIKQQLRQLGPVWPHLFRRSLATHMAEKGATEQELKNWFHTTGDWADTYVQKSGVLTEKWSKREF